MWQGSRYGKQRQPRAQQDAAPLVAEPSDGEDRRRQGRSPSGPGLHPVHLGGQGGKGSAYEGRWLNEGPVAGIGRAKLRGASRDRSREAFFYAWSGLHGLVFTGPVIRGR